jgi:hypothetical protein
MAKKQSKKSEAPSEVSLTDLEVVTGGRSKNSKGHYGSGSGRSSG